MSVHSALAAFALALLLAPPPVPAAEPDCRRLLGLGDETPSPVGAGR